MARNAKGLFMTLIRPEAFALELGKNINIFSVQAFQYKRRYGKYPDWYIRGAKKGLTMIDKDKYMRLIDTPINAGLYASDKLYWMLRATNHSDSDIARLMVKKSKYFKSIPSWNVFFSKYLFSGSGIKNILIEPTMLTEFVRIGTKHLYLLKRWNKLDLTKQKEYYEM